MQGGMGDTELHTKFLSQNLKKRDRFEDMGIDRILKWILNTIMALSRREPKLLAVTLAGKGLTEEPDQMCALRVIGRGEGLSSGVVRPTHLRK
jgi:hypothetical protein